LKTKIIVILNRLVVGGQTLDTLPLLHCLSREFDILILHGEKEKDEKDASALLEKYSLKGNTFLRSSEKLMRLMMCVHF
jgi:hypothetical protein